MRSSGLNLNRLYPAWKILFPLGVFHLRFRGLSARPPMVDLLSFYGIAVYSFVGRTLAEKALPTASQLTESYEARHCAC